MKLDINNYPGAKRNSGLDKWIINMIPETNLFVEAFAGSAHITDMLSDVQKECMYYVYEKSTDVFNQLTEKFKHKSPFVKVGNFDFFDYSQRLDKDVVCYFDPPYKKGTRYSDRDYYQWDWENTHHLDFINRLMLLSSMDVRMIVSHPKCELYDELLNNGWTRHEFNTSNRGGKTIEYVYRNFDPSKYKLLTSAFVGHNKTKRQNLKRKSETMINKVKRTEDLHERQYLIEQFIEKTNPFLCD